jgi:hypothetical protein
MKDGFVWAFEIDIENCFPSFDGDKVVDLLPLPSEIHARERAMPYRVRLKLRGVHWRINSGTIYDSQTPRVGDQIEVEIDGRHVLARVGDVRSYRPKMTGASVVDEIDAEEI